MNLKKKTNQILSDFQACLNLSNPEVKKLVKITFMVGLLAAFVEYIFAITLQEFFSQMGFLDKKSTIGFISVKFETIMLVLVFVGVIRSFTEGLKIYVSRLAQQRFAQHNRLQLVTKALNNAGTLSSAKVLSLFSDEVNRSSISILNLATICIQASLALSLFTFCIINFFKASLFGIFLLICFYAPLKLYERKVFKKGIFLSEEWEKTNYILTEGIRNNFYLKIIGKIDDEVKKAKVSLNDYFEKYKRAFFLISLKTSLPPFFGILILVTIALIHTKYSAFGSNFRFLEFFYLFLRFTQSISQTVTSLGDFKINAESTIRLQDWFRSNIDERKISEPKILPQGNLILESKNLSFGYGDKQLFNKLNFKLETGDIFVISGESGVGKSSLLYLLLGLVEPIEGEILVSGEKIENVRESLIKKLGYVGPHPFLIEGTIKDNLLYGNERKICDKDIQSALVMAKLDSTIMTLPEGLETRLNELGSRFSTGQKQRLMIARAILRDPDLVIFDEATSNLDEWTEKELIKNLEVFFKDKITVVVSHKNTFSNIASKQLRMS